LLRWHCLRHLQTFIVHIQHVITAHCMQHSSLLGRAVGPKCVNTLLQQLELVTNKSFISIFCWFPFSLLCSMCCSSAWAWTCKFPQVVASSDMMTCKFWESLSMRARFLALLLMNWLEI
jgi:hypothetical protein